MSQPLKLEDVEFVLKTDRYQKAELRSYTSLTQLALATGLDKRILKLAKKADLGGAFPANHGVNWKKLKPALEAQYANLLERLPNDELTILDKIKRADLRIKLATALKLERRLLEPDAVKKMLVELAARHSAVITKELQELPPRLAGKSEPEIKVEIDKAIAAIFKVMQAGAEAVDKLDDDA